MTAALNGHTAPSATLPVDPRPSEGYVPSGTQAPAAVKVTFTGPRRKRPRGSDPRSRDPQRQIRRFLIPMLKANARRAMGEDPEIGLAGLLEVQELVDRLVREVGVHQVRVVGGANVASGLGWTKQRVRGRWGNLAAKSQCDVPGLPLEMMPL